MLRTFPATVLLINRIRVCKVYPILYGNLHRKYKSSKPNTLTPSSSNDSEVDINVKPLGEKVKEATKTGSYFGVIILGALIAGGMFYSFFREVFSSTSPNTIYSKAVEKCIDNPQVSDKLGYPIKAYGEETRRGRRQHVSHAFYQDRQGKKHIRMKFHLKGTAHSATAHLDMVESDSGSYDYRYLFVEVDDMFKSVIVVEDNRSKLNSQSQSLGVGLELEL